MKHLISILLVFALSLTFISAFAEENADFNLDLTSLFTDENGEISEETQALLDLLSAMAEHYWEYTETQQPLEAKYTALGSHDVEYAEYSMDDENVQRVEAWYPADLKEREAWPVVIFVNGTGSKASGYQANFRHMASWGFIAVGNEDEQTRTGASTEATLLFLLAENENPDSLFYGKIDTAHIGLAGHSQGGVGIYNAVGKQPHGDQYAALFTVSATSPYWGQDFVFGEEWAYDISRIHVPTFMVAGTGLFDAGTAEDINPTEGQGITPLWSLEQNDAALPNDIVKGYARKTGKDHGDTLNGFDGYMTAWFLWQLCGDAEAAQVYIGSAPELTINTLYQDVVIHLPE